MPVSYTHLDVYKRQVRTVRERYDGKVRNPFNEYECGGWYADVYKRQRTFRTGNIH